MNFSVIFAITLTISICIVSCVKPDPDPALDEDWKKFKNENKKDYKNNKTDEVSRFDNQSSIFSLLFIRNFFFKDD
jgi:hypothetical protein